MIKGNFKMNPKPQTEVPESCCVARSKRPVPAEERDIFTSQGFCRESCDQSCGVARTFD